MLDRLVGFSLRNRAAVLFFTFVVAAWGWFSFRALTIEAFPDPTDTQVQVITIFPGQPTEEVERQIGLPIERALNGTPGLSRLRNLSLFGLSFVTLTFDDGVERTVARASRCSSACATRTCPDGVTPELGPLATPIGEVYRYTLRGAKADPMKLRTLQDWVVRPRAAARPRRRRRGELRRPRARDPRPARSAAPGGARPHARPISSRRVRAGSVNASGGVLERGVGAVRDPERGPVPVARRHARGARRHHDGTPVFLQDVATVERGLGAAPGRREPRRRRTTPSRASCSCAAARTRRSCSSALRDAVGELNERSCRRRRAGRRRSTTAPTWSSTTLHTVCHNLLEGALLVTLVLFAFLLDLRAALIVARRSSRSRCCASFIYLQAARHDARTCSRMGAVDFGIIVDGARGHRREHRASLVIRTTRRRPPCPLRPATSASSAPRARWSRPTVFSLLIIIAAYLPIFLLAAGRGSHLRADGEHRGRARWSARCSSRVTLVPVLASLVLSQADRATASRRCCAGRSRAYEPTLRVGAAATPLVLILGGAGALLAGAGVLMPRLGSEFLPELNEGALYVTFTLPVEHLARPRGASSCRA